VTKSSMVGLFNLQYFDNKLSDHYSFGIIRKLNVCSFKSCKYLVYQINHVDAERKNTKTLRHLLRLIFHA